MTLDDINLIQEIKKYKRVSHNEVRIIETFIRTFIDKKYSVCKSCKSQIQIGYQRLRGWLEANEPAIEQRRLELLQPEPEQKLCEVCNNPVDDKRKTYCKSSCKKKAAKAKIKK